MNRDSAEAAVTGSALVVGAIYLFRRFSETEVTLTNAHGLRLKQLAGAGPVLPVGPFVVGWGFTFLVCSLLAQASPRLGGGFAILIATGAVLGNGEHVFSDLNSKLSGGGGSAKGPPTNAGGSLQAPGIPQQASPAPLYPVVHGYTTPIIVHHAD